MKLFFLTLSLLCAFSLSANSKEYLPEFYLELSEKDPALGEKSLFIIRFEGLPEYDKAVHVLWSMDGKRSVRSVLNEQNALEVYAKPGEHSFQFFYDAAYTEIQTEKVLIHAGYRDIYIARFESAEVIYTIEKPVIYLYPEQSTELEVKVEPAGKMLFTYPALNDSWKMTAHPNGDLEIDGKSYPYLFWEAENPRISANWSEGSIVEKENLVDFLEAQLDEIGLNGRERADFITYWAPRMSGHARCAIHFLQNSECAVFADLNVLPQPQAINRVYILWSGIDNLTDNIYLRPQKLQKISRLGFDVLEWGGVEMTEYPVKIEEL